MDKLSIRIFTATVLIVIGCFGLNCSFAAVVRPKVIVTQMSAIRVVMSSALYCVNYEDGRGQHHPWVCAVPPMLGGNDSRLTHQLRSIGIISVDNSWLRQTKLPKHFLYVEIKDLKGLSHRRVRVRAYMCLDLNEEALTEALATLSLKDVNGKWIVDSKDSLIETGD